MERRWYTEDAALVGFYRLGAWTEIGDRSACLHRYTPAACAGQSMPPGSETLCEPSENTCTVMLGLGNTYYRNRPWRDELREVCVIPLFLMRTSDTIRRPKKIKRRFCHQPYQLETFNRKRHPTANMGMHITHKTKQLSAVACTGGS